MQAHTSAEARARARARARAFTLIELAIVVCIVGVLAVLGVVGYRRYMATAHTSEATSMTAGIRAAQEAYKTERGVYAAVSTNQNALYPAASKPGKFVTAWGAPCTNCVGGDPNGWKKLAVEPHEPVMFGYATVAGIGGSSLAGETSTQGLAANGLTGSAATELKETDPYYVTVAWGDTDGDGTPCIVLSYSTSNQLVIQASGE